MSSGRLSGVIRFLLWDYPRASWQYDLMVAMILAFIFLTPREFFKDWPQASTIARVSSEHGLNVFWVDPELLNSIPESDRASRVQQMLRSRNGRRETVVRVEPIFGNEREIEGYTVFTKP